MICVRLPYCPTLMTFPLLPQPRIIPCIFLSLFSHTFSNFIFSRISFFLFVSSLRSIVPPFPSLPRALTRHHCPQGVFLSLFFSYFFQSLYSPVSPVSLFFFLFVPSLRSIVPPLPSLPRALTRHLAPWVLDLVAVEGYVYAPCRLSGGRYRIPV